MRISTFKIHFVALLLLIVFQSTGFSQSIFPKKYLIDYVNNDSSQSGWLKLISDTPINTVWIDSIEIPVDQNLIIELEAGAHHLQLRSQNPADWFQRDVFKTINIKTNDTLQFFVKFPEFKMINSDPYGADILVDGLFFGRTPFLIKKEILSDSQVILSKHGYRDTTLSIVDQFFPTIWVTLESDQKIQKRSDQKIQLRIAQKKRLRNYALLTFGLSLASGATAYFTKKEADKNYDRYLTTGNPQEMNRLYDLTERYDRISAGSYIFFEINLLASAYFFFRYLLNR